MEASAHMWKGVGDASMNFIISSARDAAVTWPLAAEVLARFEDIDREIEDDKGSRASLSLDERRECLPRVCVGVERILRKNLDLGEIMLRSISPLALVMALQLEGCNAFTVQNSFPRATAAIQATMRVPSADVVAPLNDHILVDLQSVPSQTTTGILLPTAFLDDEEDDAFAAPEPRAGTILAIGPGRVSEDGTKIPMPDLKVGQKIVVGPSKGEQLKLENVADSESTLFLFRPDEIWGPCE